MSASDSWLNPATQFEELYALEYGRILAFLKNLVQGEAEDLTQDTFLKAYRARLTYVPRTPPGAWLMRIARNAAISHMRRHRLRYEQPLEDIYFTDTRAYADIDNRDLVSDIVGMRLTYKQCQILALRYGEDMSWKQVGRHLNISPSTMWIRTHKAMATLRAAV